MPDLQESLTKYLHGNPAPFLFVGAGLSRRYVATDSWEHLLRRFSDMTSHTYEYYYTSANGDLPTVASKLGEVFHELWWSDERFSESRDLWASKLTSPSSALKVEVARYVCRAVDNIPTSGPLSKELDLLKQAVVDGIITTNFDPLLEFLFPDYQLFVGQNELLFSNSQQIGEIYKIHGSCSNPESLVLTAEDYVEFEHRNAYLAAKLMTIFVEHPIIFLGYSLNDSNVVSILRSIAACLTRDNIDDLRDRLIFVEWEEGTAASIGPQTLVVDDVIIPVVGVKVPDFSDVFTVLTKLHRTFPAKLLRKLKEHVYELVLQNDPNRRLVVADIEDDTNEKDIDVVFGVGVHASMGEHGYVGIDRWQLIDDLLEGGSKLDAKRVVAHTLPDILKGSGNVPVFKYLREAEALDSRGNIKRAARVSPKIEAMAAKIRGGLPASKVHKEKASAFLADISGLSDLESKHGMKGVVDWGTLLPPNKVKHSELREFLRAHRELRTAAWSTTQYVKLACFYDWLVYGRSQSRR